MQDGAQNRNGMQGMRNVEGGILDEKSWWDRDVLISLGETWDSFEIDNRMRDLNSK